MGVIQQGINQLIGTAAIAARLSPGFETRQELLKLGKQEKALGMQQEALPTISPDEMEEGKTIAAQQHQEILEKQAEVAQKQFELQPTKESMRKATFARSAAGQGPIMTLPADPDEILREQQELQEQKGQIRAQEKGAKQVKQKRNFMNYLKNLETNFGGKVGDLPENVQKIIAKQYSKSQRQKIMQEMDKGDKK